MKVEWEEVEQEHSGHLFRAKVPGGYLWRHTESVALYNPDISSIMFDQTWTHSITFQPDLQTCMMCDGTGKIESGKFHCPGCNGRGY